MKSILSIFIIALLIVSCQSEKKSGKDDSVDLAPLTITMDINGMTCNGCVEKCNKARSILPLFPS